MSLYDTCFDWQKSLLDLQKDKTSFGWFIGCGLGKTLLGLSCAEMHNCKKVIIITINSKAIESEKVNGSFLYWAKRSSIDYEIFDKKVIDKDDNPFIVDKPQLLIINYEALFIREKNRGESRKKKFNLRPQVINFIKSCKGSNTAIILDESHKIQDDTTIQTGCVFEIQKELQAITSVYSYAMSGTPTVSGYISIYSQLKFLGCPMYKTKFKEQFCLQQPVWGQPSYVTKIVGYKNLDNLFRIIHFYGITLAAESVIKLPEQIFYDIKCESSEQFELFTHEKVKGTRIVNESNSREKDKQLPDLSEYQTDKKVMNPYYRNIDYPSFDLLADTTISFWTRCRQLSIGFVGNRTEAYWYNRDRLNKLEQFLEQNEDNYVLFYSYIPEFLEIYDICEKLGYNIDVWNGDIKSMTFYEKYSNQTPSERMGNTKNIILGNWASMSTGLNLQAYHNAILFDIPAYKDYAQGIDRIHRIGSKEKAIYYRFTSDNFLDDGMTEALNGKIDYTDELFESELRKEQIKCMME